MTAIKIAAAIVFAAAVGLAAGDVRPAPDVTVQDAKGAPVRLADFKGRVVLIDFWASWCPPCKASFPALDALYREYRDKGVEVVAINVDERRKDADAFLADHPHEMTVLFDSRGRAPTAFHVTAMPTSILIDRAGNIRFTHAGYTEKTLESYRDELNTLLAAH